MVDPQHVSDTERLDKLTRLLFDCIPEIELRIEGLQKLRPGREVLTVLYKTEALLLRINREVLPESKQDE